MKELMQAQIDRVSHKQILVSIFGRLEPTERCRTKPKNHEIENMVQFLGFWAPERYAQKLD